VPWMISSVGPVWEFFFLILAGCSPCPRPQLVGSIRLSQCVLSSHMDRSDLLQARGKGDSGRTLPLGLSAW
jgi:hypothetical protein